MPFPDSLTRAFALGAVSGLRTFGALAPLGVRGRLGGRAGRFVFPVLLAGEMAGDKLPVTPPRSDPPAVAGRVAAGAVAGRTAAGATGAGLGAAGAAATIYVSERTRAAVAQRTGIPDPLLGAAEDLLVVAIATVATRDGEPVQAPESAPEVLPEPADPPQPSMVTSAARGLVASLVGTAAMTTVQTAYAKATGAQASHAPEQVGRRIIHRAFGRRVPRKHRPALNQGMHFLYGTSWGALYGVVARTRSGRTSPLLGLALGAVVWAVGLAELPALDLAPPPWEQSPLSLGDDLAFHLVYGAATGAAYSAFGG